MVGISQPPTAVRTAFLLVALLGTTTALHAQGRTATAAAPQRAPVDTTILSRLSFRGIGPANMMGRATDVEGVPGDPNLVYVGTASSGVWKTTNGGTTWKPLFEQQPTMSIGDIALEFLQSVEG